jgi:hypothetical protein
MKFFLRILGCGSAALTVIFSFGSAYAFYYAVSRSLVRDFALSVLFPILAVLAFKCTAWLWASVPFWRSRERSAEVGALVALTLCAPVAAQFESMTEGMVRCIVQVSVLLIALLTYLFLRYSTRNEERAEPVATANGPAGPWLI